jgi:hypothetical protein
VYTASRTVYREMPVDDRDRDSCGEQVSQGEHDLGRGGRRSGTEREEQGRRGGYDGDAGERRYRLAGIAGDPRRTPSGARGPTSLAALAIAAVAIREGRASWRGEGCCDACDAC